MFFGLLLLLLLSTLVIGTAILFISCGMMIESEGKELDEPKSSLVILILFSQLLFFKFDSSVILLAKLL